MDTETPYKHFDLTLSVWCTVHMWRTARWMIERLIASSYQTPLEKLTGFQLVKKWPAIYATRKFITVFTCARHLSLSWASSIQSISSHPTAWRSILMLSSHKSNETPTWCNTVQVLFLQSVNTHSVPALIRRCDDLPATITHVPVAVVLVLNTPDDGRLRPKHVEWLCRNKTCTVLHQVSVSFDLYYDTWKHNIKKNVILPSTPRSPKWSLSHILSCISGS